MDPHPQGRPRTVDTPLLIWGSTWSGEALPQSVEMSPGPPSQRLRVVGLHPAVGFAGEGSSVSRDAIRTRPLRPIAAVSPAAT